MSRPPLPTLVLALALMATVWLIDGGRGRDVGRRSADVEHDGLCDTTAGCQVDVVRPASLCLEQPGEDDIDAVRWHHHHRSLYASRRSGQLRHATDLRSVWPAPSIKHPLAHGPVTRLSSPPFTRRL